MIVASQAAHVFFPVAGPAQHLLLGRMNRPPLLILARMSIPSSYGGLYPPRSLVGGCASPSALPEISKAGFRRRRLRAMSRREATKSLRFSRQRAPDSDTTIVIVASGTVRLHTTSQPRLVLLEARTWPVTLERSGCSFREAVAFLTLLEAEHPHGRTAGARQEPQLPLFFVGLSRKAERYSALAPITHSKRPGGLRSSRIRSWLISTSCVKPIASSWWKRTTESHAVVAS